MSAIVNGIFHLQETWIVTGVALDENSVALDLTGATVRLRVATAKGVTVLDLSTPSDGSIASPTSGEYEFVVSPTQQVGAEIAPGAHKYEVKVTLASGRQSVQNIGTITVMPSLFASA